MTEITKDPRFVGTKVVEFDMSLVPVYYSYFFNPDTKYESVWKTTLQLTADQAAGMAKVGFNVKQKDFGNGMVDIITAKRKTHTREGKAMFPPRIFGPDAKPWDETVLIGNGTIMNLKVGAVYREVNGNTSLPLYLNSGQVVTLVEYSGSGFKPIDQEKADVPY